MQRKPTNLISPMALDLLLEAGVVVRAEPGGSDGDIVMMVREASAGAQSVGTLAFRVERLRRALTGAAVEDLARRWPGDGRPAEGSAPGVLVVCDRASVRARAVAVEHGVSVVALRGLDSAGPGGHLITPDGLVVPLGRPPDADDVRRSPPGPAQWSRLLVIRTLVLLGPRRQIDLAELAGVSQPRVSQICADLVRDGLLAPRTLRVVDWQALVDRWLRDYPGPGGVTTYWYGLASISDQAAAVLECLAKIRDEPRVVPRVSGELAADLISPWGRPASTDVYTATGADLSVARLTPCPAAEATVRLTVPQDPGVWAMPPQSRRSGERVVPLADPLQVLYDLRQAPGDAAQTADRLRADFQDVVAGWRAAVDASPVSSVKQTS